MLVSPGPNVTVRSLPSVKRSFGSLVVTSASAAVPKPPGRSTVTLTFWPSLIGLFLLWRIVTDGFTSSSKTVNSFLATTWSWMIASSVRVTGTS